MLSLARMRSQVIPRKRLAASAHLAARTCASFDRLHLPVQSSTLAVVLDRHINHAMSGHDTAVLSWTAVSTSTRALQDSSCHLGASLPLRANSWLSAAGNQASRPLLGGTEATRLTLKGCELL